MASTFGKKFRVTLDGTPALKEMMVKIEGVPVGTVIDYGQLTDLIRRWDDSTGFYGGTAFAEEEREIIWKTGVANFGSELGIVTETTVEASVENPPLDEAEWKEYRLIPRPGHVDFAALKKDGPEADIMGGGRFSEKLSVGLCIAGGLAKQILAKRGIEVLSDISEISGSRNPLTFDDIIDSTIVEEDSVGGVVECAVMGLEAGSCGDSYFDSLGGHIAQAVFGIPGICGVEFGSGFAGTSLSGSENNDHYVVDEDGNVRTATNNHGGILGGIATGMPVVFRVAVSPAPSIGKEQVSVNLETMRPEYIKIKGMKSACNVYQTAACVEAAAAIAVLDALLSEEEEMQQIQTDSEEKAVAKVENYSERPFGLLGKKLGHFLEFFNLAFNWNVFKHRLPSGKNGSVP